MRLLLTGASGFVAPHVARAARARFGDDIEIIGAALADGAHADIGAIHGMDLGDTGAVQNVFAACRPTHVIHLGGVSAPPAVEADPELAWNVNVLGALRCARALFAGSPEGVFVFAGSAQVYGDAQGVDGALTEDAPLAPLGEYAATKAAADVALGALSRRGLNVVRFRPFNHTGPGQTEDFVVARFAGQIARIEAGLQAPVLRVGNLEARRDFLDVRDVADAYVAALAQPAAGGVFNLASGRAESIGWILRHLVGLARMPVTVETDPALWRANDARLLIGDAARARAVLDWRPTRTLEQTLADVLEHARLSV
jgi:GDP-4-dehydro-6-deoxy-D-mannose reductase